MECADVSKPAPALELPNELWVKILKNFETSDLLKLTLVCKHFNRIIFTHMADRLQLTIDERDGWKTNRLSSERRYKHLCWITPYLDPLSEFFAEAKQLAPKVESLTLGLWRIDWKVLLQLLKLCTRMKSLCIEAVQSYNYTDFIWFEKSFTLPVVTSLKIEIKSSGGWDEILLPCFPNLLLLQMALHHPINASLITNVVSQLVGLHVEASDCAMDSILALRLPALKVLQLDWEKLIQIPDIQAFMDFLMECKMLETLTIWFAKSVDQGVINAIYNSLPHVETLRIVTESKVCLNELHRMKYLKDLEIGRLLDEEHPIPMPQVQKFKCTIPSFLYNNNRHADQILKRFPNLVHLELSICVSWGVSHPRNFPTLSHVVYCLKKLTIEICQFTKDMIDPLLNLVYLKELTIETYGFAKTNFRLLRRIIILPKLQRLEIIILQGPRRNFVVPIEIIQAVAAANPTCQLTVNGQLVLPPAAVVGRRTQAKRKYPQQK